MPESLTHRKPARLNCQDGQVVVTPQDRDLFLTSAEKATEACKDAIRLEERVKRFTEDFIVPLCRWCEQNRDLVHACYVGFPESSVLPIYLVGRGERYDFQLTERAAAMAVDFNDAGWAVHASQIPHCDPEALGGYFDMGGSMQVYP